MAKQTNARTDPGTRELQCHLCHAWAPAWEMVHAGTIEAGYRDLCSRCWNEEIAGARGLDFHHFRFERSDMADVAGTVHRFHFLLRHLGDRLCLEAFELQQGEPAGYRFEVVGPPDIDPLDLMGRLVERMRDALAKQYLIEGELGLAIAGTDVRGRIDCDPDSYDRIPVLVIDGRELSWNEFGRMLMTFEGWRFKLTIDEPGDEIS